MLNTDIGSSSKWTLRIPNNVGYYEIYPNCRFYSASKPNRWHRFWARVLLGWRWYDVGEEG